MSAGSGKGKARLHTALAQRVAEGIVQAYSVLLTLGLAGVTGLLAMGVMAGMSIFMMIFISLLVVSAWQAALPKLWMTITKHSRDSIMLMWTSTKQDVLDCLEAYVRLLNGKGRLSRSIGKLVEIDENVSPLSCKHFQSLAHILRLRCVPDSHT